MKYEFEGIRYDITIREVYVFPQCFAAISPSLSNMEGDYLVIDIGSKTTDVLYLRNGIPVKSKSITIEKAMVKWMKQVQGNLQIQFGKNIPESEILKVILKQSNFLSKAYANLIRNDICEQFHFLELYSGRDILLDHKLKNG